MFFIFFCVKCTNKILIRATYKYCGLNIIVLVRRRFHVEPNLNLHKATPCLARAVKFISTQHVRSPNPQTTFKIDITVEQQIVRQTIIDVRKIGVFGFRQTICDVSCIIRMELIITFLWGGRWFWNGVAYISGYGWFTRILRAGRNTLKSKNHNFVERNSNTIQ